MYYEEFKNKLYEELQKVLSEKNIVLRRINQQKVNENLDGIVVRYPDSQIAPIIYTDDMFERYQDGCSMSFIVDKVTKKLNDIHEKAPELPKFTASEAQECLYSVVVNADMNQEMLRDVPHERFADLAIIPRYKVGEEANIVVTNDMCGLLRMTSEEILETARANTMKENFECRHISDMIRTLMKGEGLPEGYIKEVFESTKDSPMYILSNECRVEGAIAIALNEKMEAAYEKVKKDHPDMKDLYVLGSSRHELVLVPDDAVESLEELKAINNGVQESEVKRCDKLTDHIYKFDALEKQISIADNLEMMKEDVVEKMRSFGRSR